MTDNNESEAVDAPVERTPIQPVVDLYKRPEHNLAELAAFADFAGFPLTFYMPWGIATGNTANPNDYYKHLAESVRGGNKPEDSPQEWLDLIDRFAATNYDPYTELTYSERQEGAIVDGFDLNAQIILRDASCWIGGFSEPIRHDFLRVRLTDVTAWAWGARHAPD